MMDTTRARNIPSNIGRAAQCEIEGDSRSELRFQLFAAGDIIDMLATYRNDHATGVRLADRMDAPTAKRYAKQLVHISNRIQELINDGI